MTIQVTVTHTNCGYAKNLKITECNEVGQAIKGTDRMLRGGETATFPVHSARQLHIEEHVPPIEGPIA